MPKTFYELYTTDNKENRRSYWRSRNEYPSRYYANKDRQPGEKVYRMSGPYRDSCYTILDQQEHRFYVNTYKD